MFKRLFFAALFLTAFPALSQAASVDAVSKDNLELQQLGSTYIHSRHVGTMPYWGECYRCAPQVVNNYCTTQTNPSGFEYTEGGNDLYIQSANCSIYSTDASDTEENTGLADSITYDDTTNVFSGAIDLTGLTQEGVICGGNSGIQGENNTIVALNDPTPDSTSSTCDANQDASGGPITLTGTEFGGSPITVENAWGFFTVSPGDNCLNFSFNNESLGAACLFPASMEIRCHHYAPTSSQCETTSYDDFGAPEGVYGCGSGSTWGGTCSSSLSGSDWLWGFDDGNTGTAVGGYFTLSSYYDNSSGNAIPSVISMEADSYGWLFVNGQQVLSCAQGSDCTANYNMPTGYDYISYVILSAPENASDSTRDPAAGIVSIIDSATGSALVSSNGSSWWMSPVLPGSLSPSMQTVLDDNGDSAFSPKSCTADGSNC